MRDNKKLGAFDFGEAVKDPTFQPERTTRTTQEKKIISRNSIEMARESEFKTPVEKSIDGRHLRQTNRTRLISLKVEPSVPAKLDSILEGLGADSRGHAVEILVERWLHQAGRTFP